LHQALIILSIWAYAFITGLPSSVIRASLMFSLLAAGKMMKRSTDNFNILAVAAFAQLCINPYELTDVGFQLSYLAVLGIFAFYQPLNEWISSNRRVITWLWSVLAVSIAAQLATFPLSSYYFNMFPVYFLLTNLIVVPLAGVITYFAVALLIIGAAGIYYGWLALPLDWSLKIMLEAVEMIQSWPGAVIQQIVFSIFQVVLVYSMILSLYGFFILENKKWIFVLGGSLLIFLLIYTDIQYNQMNTGKIVVYNVPGHSAIDLIHRKSCLFIGDSLILQDEKKIRFQMAPNRLHSGITQINSIDISNDEVFISHQVIKSSSFIEFLSNRMVIIDEKWNGFHAGNKLPCRLVVFTGKTKVNPADVFAQLDMEQVVIAGSVPIYQTDRIRQSCTDHNIPCHPVKDLGAYLLECK
jgi:competence protein ComEC